MKSWVMTFLLLISTLQLANPIDVQEILAESDRVMHPENLQGSFRMILVSPRGNERSMEVMAYQRRRSETREDRLFIFTHPPSVEGTGLLVHSYDEEEDRMWIYLPAVDALKRVNLSTSGGGYFMGSDFTYSDLISAPREEFDFELLGDAQVNGEACYLVRKQGQSREVQRRYGYSFEEHYIRKSDMVAIKVVFYDLAGDLLKELRVQDVQVIGPYRYPSDVIMENMQSGHRSEIVFGDIQVPENIPDDFFTQRYLQNR